MRHSNWTIPPLGSGFKSDLWALPLPVLYPYQLHAYPIPNIDTLPQQCPIIAFADFHQDIYGAA